MTTGARQSLRLDSEVDTEGPASAPARRALDPGEQRILDQVRQAAAEHAERRLAGVLECITDGFCILDRRRRFTYVNGEAARLLQRPKSELLGQSALDAFPAVLGTPLETECSRALELGVSVSFEAPCLPLGLLLEVRAYPMPEGLALLFSDITARRRAEEDRTRAEQDGAKARADAEAENHAKDEFLSIVSHELRTPLTAILGWSNILQRTPPSAAALRRGLETIERNARAQAQLIEDILDISRIVAQKLRIELRTVDLAVALRTALDVVKPSADTHGLSLEGAIAPDPVLITGDAGRLQQVVLNLLTNSIKFTPAGGRVEARLCVLGDVAELSVTDTGQGIPAESLPYVFMRFWQGDEGATRRTGGLGIGLAIAKHIVDLHGGSIAAASDGPGCGATFTVKLPLREGDIDSKDRASLAADVGRLSPVPPRLDGARVLVVDDDADARELFATILRAQGAGVTVATSADEALEALVTTEIDVLVSDIGMPVEDGYALLERVRAVRPRGRDLPALALTAYASADDVKRALAAGYAVHLAKPVAACQLIAAVAHLVGRASE